LALDLSAVWPEGAVTRPLVGLFVLPCGVASPNVEPGEPTAEELQPLPELAGMRKYGSAVCSLN